MTEKNGDDDKHSILNPVEAVVLKTFDMTARVEILTAKLAAETNKKALQRLYLHKELQQRIDLARDEQEKLTAMITQMRGKLDVERAVKQPKRSTPPASAAFLLAFIAPKNSAQALLGDLEEIFQKNAERFGETQARRMYWFEVARSFGPLVWQWIKRMGFVTLVVDYVRSKFGL